MSQEATKKKPRPVKDKAIDERTPLGQSIASWRMSYGSYFYVPPKFAPLLETPKRIKVFYGGRGAAKTMTIAECIVYLMHSRYPIEGQPFRVLCGREYQNSISESVHFEIVGAIQRMGLSPWFKTTGTTIRHRLSGSACLFRGLHHNIDQIRSLGGIDLFWGEEAHGLAADSLVYIEPTIRRDPPFGPCGAGSELWYSLNQELDDDPIYVRYKLAQGAWEDKRHLIVPVTWKDNPFFPHVLEDQRAQDEAQLPRDEYEWTWGTQCRNMGGIFFSLSNLLVNNKPIEMPTLCDSVFAIIDTATKTGRENDGTAVTYFAVNRHGTAIPLMILDWDIAKIEGSLLEAWLPTVFGKLADLAKLCRARFGSLGAFIEDKASGTILLQQAKRREWRATAIDSKLTAMGKVERAISVSGYVFRQMVKITQPAFDKVVPYNGVTLNHQVSQVTRFRVADTETKEDDLLDTFTYGCAIALGNAEGF